MEIILLICRLPESQCARLPISVEPQIGLLSHHYSLTHSERLFCDCFYHIFLASFFVVSTRPSVHRKKEKYCSLWKPTKIFVYAIGSVRTSKFIPCADDAEFYSEFFFVLFYDASIRYLPSLRSPKLCVVKIEMCAIRAIRQATPTMPKCRKITKINYCRLEKWATRTATNCSLTTHRSLLTTPAQSRISFWPFPCPLFIFVSFYEFHASFLHRCTFVRVAQLFRMGNMRRHMPVNAHMHKHHSVFNVSAVN